VTLNFILGTAAELIKVFPVIRLAEERGHTVRLIATGQSRENLIMQLEDFGYSSLQLSWLVESEGDLEKSSAAMKWFIRALCAWRNARRLMPDGFVVVHGDTLSTLAGAWHGRLLRRTVVHIEAGLRSPRLLNPFPEEINRRLVSRLARIHMAPDQKALANLRAAGVKGEVICTNGNTLLDAVRLSGEGRPAKSRYALVNVHRFENLNSPERWKTIVACVERAARALPVIFVTHPQTKHKLEQDPAARRAFESVDVRDRMPFSQFIGLLKSADYLISDGGSNQEECSYLGKPCLLLREATERIEGLDGCCVLSRFSPATIDAFLKEPDKYKRAPVAPALSPSEIILNHLNNVSQ
jgi:UDP-N-acetylglucosamine 2-epimerase (non-hydrolysing)